MTAARDQGFVWTVRIGAGEGESATVFARKRRFEVGAPLHFDEEYPEVSALECLLGAIGADLVNGLRLHARRRRVAIDQVEATVQGRLRNPLAYLGVVGEVGHPGLERVEVRVYASTAEAPERLAEVWREAIERSPLARTFQSFLELELKVVH